MIGNGEKSVHKSFPKWHRVVEVESHNRYKWWEFNVSDHIAYIPKYRIRTNQDQWNILQYNIRKYYKIIEFYK